MTLYIYISIVKCKNIPNVICCIHNHYYNYIEKNQLLLQSLLVMFGLLFRGTGCVIKFIMTGTEASSRRKGEFSIIIINISSSDFIFHKNKHHNIHMLLVLSITVHFHYNIWGCMCSTGPFQFRWLKGCIQSSCYYHHQIGSINLTHCYNMFPWLCAWDVSYIIFCHLLHIHSGKTGILFSLLLCSL